MAEVRNPSYFLKMGLFPPPPPPSSGSESNGNGNGVQDPVTYSFSNRVGLYPDLSGLAIRNPNEYDTRRCGLDHHKCEPGECWNVSAQPYLNSFNTFLTSDYATVISQLENASAVGNYGQGEQLALEGYEWANSSLNDLSVHEDWIAHMKTNITLDRRCCVSRTGGNNFNNGYIPVQQELRAKLENFRDEMQGYVFQFQGVVPPPSATATGQEDEGYTSSPNLGMGATFGPEGSMADSEKDSENQKKFLVGAGIAIVVLIGLVIFLRR